MWMESATLLPILHLCLRSIRMYGLKEQATRPCHLGVACVCARDCP